MFDMKFVLCLYCCFFVCFIIHQPLSFVMEIEVKFLNINACRDGELPV